MPGGESAPPEAARSSRPEDPAWRADGLAGSRHSRLADELRRPREMHDEERAREICAAVARLALQDLAPALTLLPTEERRRAQALAAYALTLFDFARQAGLEGERLAQINRWQFELEAALDGSPTGQPVFLLLAAEEGRRAWPREGFDALHQAARGRVTRSRPTTASAAATAAQQLGGAICRIWLGADPPRGAVALAAALLRLRGLQTLGDALRRGRPQLPMEELPGLGAAAGDGDRGRLAEPIALECRRIRLLLEEAERDIDRIEPVWRRPAGYLLLTGHRLVRRIERLSDRIVDASPSLGLGARLGLLARARWLTPGASGRRD